ncbi:hypothetical protein, variant [Aphanomyces invadans]|uniref:ODAD1 central coiled coil region domain-containing protein n=1 Tax=Aphanomyces invadans TaxID=157072 RepID=A0A024TEL0_9STRA|nr:hypothetical protein, variant [Aphanomyces invadans]ETV92424.1 hypothetical protein, variant [Aphanomyces invadans]|eukprot:XP_008878975.1 hypothetical protein, variant [Aphanomyces invadans]
MSAAFSTRFLASDGIPAYNALLDQHLGHHRTYLLGSKASLKLLQTTGAIAKVEPGKSADQYVVYVEEPSAPPCVRKPRVARSSSDDSSTRPCDKRTRKPMAASPDSGTAPTTTSETNRPRLRHSASDVFVAPHKKKDHKLKKATEIEPMAMRPQVKPGSPFKKAASEPATKPSWTDPTAASLVKDEHPQRGVHKPVVNHLLESDVAYREKITRFKAQLAAMATEKAEVQVEIARLRKDLRGVNAVHENDMAVAHCNAVMQHRLGKAQDEYMKVLTQQAAIRTTIDAARLELLALAQVRRKLEGDLNDTNAKIDAAEARIEATKAIQKSTFGELTNLERQAEADAVDRIVKLPPESDVVNMDVSNLMASIHDRALSRKQELAARHNAAAERTSASIATDGSLGPLDATFTMAFASIQDAVHAPSVDEFVTSFVDTENQLLSMYQHHLDQLAETKKAKAELEALLSQARTVRHRVRQQQEDVHARKAQLMDRIAHVKHMTQEYITLQRRQAVEHDALRGPILHLLDVLKADKHFLHTNGFLNTAQDMPLPHILGIAQERIVEFAILSQVHNKQLHAANVKVQAMERFNRRTRQSTPESPPASAVPAPTAAATIVVGPRVPSASTVGNVSAQTSMGPTPRAAEPTHAVLPRSFEDLANNTTLPSVLSTESSLDSVVPLSSFQLFQRALRSSVQGRHPSANE